MPDAEPANDAAQRGTGRRAGPIGSISSRADTRGIIHDAARNTANRRLSALSIGVPLVGAMAAIAYGLTHRYAAVTWVVFILFFYSTAFGISIGLHRYFTHQAFEVSPVPRAVLAVLGTWAMQGPIDRWVADHRRHHRFADRPGDPHSPYFDEQGARSGLRGLWHAHLGWKLTGLDTGRERYAADILEDDITRIVSRFYWPIAYSAWVLAMIAGYLANGWRGAVEGVLLGGAARVALLHQLTYSINSFGHSFGTRVAGARDESRDSVLLAVLLLGEGLHSFHHRYPSTAVNRPLRLDASGLLICLLERLRIVRQPRRDDLT
jgi:stearoyl-CoA desaturase (Delta-9 desaturase)